MEYSAASVSIKARAFGLRPVGSTSILLGALIREQFRPHMPGIVLGVSVWVVPNVEPRLSPTPTRVDVDEVGILGCPVERLGTEQLAGNGGDLLRLESNLYHVLLHIFLLLVSGQNCPLHRVCSPHRGKYC